MKITKDMTIGEVVKTYPQTMPVFMKFQMGCFGCGMAQMETLEQGCTAHGIDVDKFLEELNKAAEEESE